MPAICRIGDAHACGAVAVSASPNVRANSIFVHRKGDADTHGATQAEGSPNVRINGIPVARIGDNHSGDAYHLPNPQVAGSSNTFANGR